VRCDGDQAPAMERLLQGAGAEEVRRA